MSDQKPFEPMASVQEFIERMGVPRDLDLWRKLMEEEAEEVIDALSHLVKEVCDMLYVTCGYADSEGERENTILETDTTKVDFATYVLDMLINAGLGPLVQQSFNEVHRSNMSKLGDDGEPIRREDGKIMKGPNYTPANVRSIVDLTIARGTDVLN